MLLVGSRSPNKLLISKASGKIHQLEFYPSYNSQCLLERNESVPFRLTRNLTSLFTPYGVEGWFVSTLTAAAEVNIICKSALSEISNCLSTTGDFDMEGIGFIEKVILF